MAQQRRGLGKGLGALIPEAPRAGGADAGSMTGTPQGAVGIIGYERTGDVHGSGYEAADSGLLAFNPTHWAIHVSE